MRAFFQRSAMGEEGKEIRVLTKKIFSSQATDEEKIRAKELKEKAKNAYLMLC